MHQFLPTTERFSVPNVALPHRMVESLVVNQKLVHLPDAVLDTTSRTSRRARVSFPVMEFQKRVPELPVGLLIKKGGSDKRIRFLQCLCDGFSILMVRIP